MESNSKKRKTCNACGKRYSYKDRSTHWATCRPRNIRQDSNSDSSGNLGNPSKLHSNIMERLQARREMMESDHGGQADDEVSSYEFSLT